MLFLLTARNKLSQGVALLFFVGTLLATVSTGEHYVADLAPGVAFGCCLACVAYRQLRLARLYLAVVLCWSVAVRFLFLMLIGHPLLSGRAPRPRICFLSP